MKTDEQKKHLEALEKGTFLLVCSGESYSAEIVKWPAVLDAMMKAMFGEDHAEKSEERQSYKDELEEPDNWSHDHCGWGPTRWSEAVGETDHIELVLITEANYVLLEQLVVQKGDNKLSGQIAYEAYCESTGWKSAVSGQPLPQWEQVKHDIKRAWQAAGNAVKLVAEKTWPDIGPDPLRERDKVKPGIKGVLERTCGPCVLQQPQTPDQTGLFYRWDVDQLRSEVIWRTAAMEGRAKCEETLLAWGVGKWNDEVKNRPLVNVHRRTLDGTWRQVIRYAGGDPVKLLGAGHDELVAQSKGTVRAKYVVGFMFNPDLNRVAVIRKSKPEWQRGKLNGPGGKIEGGESAALAMVREFQEETGYVTTQTEWAHFADMEGGANDDGGSFYVAYFATFGLLEQLKSCEAEPVEILNLAELHVLREDVVENLPWLVSMALDRLRDGRPHFAAIQYP